MKKNRAILFVIASLMVCCAGSDNRDFSTKNFSVIKLADGVYACINKPGGKAIGNSGIVDNGEATIIFDALLSPDAAEELIGVVEQMKLSSIKYVINSHFDNDHVRGNQCFASDMKIVSTKRTAELIREEEPKAIAGEKVYAKELYEYYDSLDRDFKGDTSSSDYITIRLMKPYFEELSLSHLKIRTRVPDTFIEGEKSPDGSKIKVSLIDKGAGHTESDMIMYLPEESILFAGDLVFNKAHPYLNYGYTEELKAKLTDLETMKPQIVVPGHGDPGGVVAIISTREYIKDIERTAMEMKDAGKSIEDTGTVPMPEKYKDWMVGSFFHSNLKYMFNHLGNLISANTDCGFAVKRSVLDREFNEIDRREGINFDRIDKPEARSFFTPPDKRIQLFRISFRFYINAPVGQVLYKSRNTQLPCLTCSTPPESYSLNLSCDMNFI